MTIHADLFRIGYMAAAMGRPLEAGAPEDFRRGYYSFRPEDGSSLTVESVYSLERLEGHFRAEGVLPDRRRNPDPGQTRKVQMEGWEAAIWLGLAFLTGLALPAIATGLHALGGAA